MIGFALSGCGYTVRPPFDRSIKTVYVPTFKSQRFRRDLNLQFTEMLQQEIRLRTPYSVVGSPEGADATLEGIITFDDKNVQVESPNNLPRHLLSTIMCTVRFTDNRTKTTTTKRTPPAIVAENSPFYPEVGETASLGFQKGMQKMARDVVSMMESTWGEEYRKDIDEIPLDPTDRPIAPRRRPGQPPLPESER
jgi:hypothetical protein